MKKTPLIPIQRSESRVVAVKCLLAFRRVESKRPNIHEGVLVSVQISFMQVVYIKLDLAHLHI